MFPRLFFMRLEKLQLLGKPGAALGVKSSIERFQVHLLLTRRAAWQFALALYKVDSQELERFVPTFCISNEIGVYRVTKGKPDLGLIQVVFKDQFN